MSAPRTRWPQRLVFSLLPAALLLAGAEIALRATGWRGSTIAEIRATEGFAIRYYVAQRDRVLGDWFERGRSTDGRPWARSNPELVPRGFHDQNFPVDPADESLIFALGGSTTQGIPYELEERGFPERLEGLLADQGWRGRPARVINAGVAGMDSSSFPRMATEVIDLGADALLIYAGHNELQGALLRDCTDPYRQGLARLGSRLVTLRWARSTWRELSGWTPPDTPALVDAQQACIEHAVQHWSAERSPAAPGPRRDPGYLRTLVNLERNLDRVLSRAESARVPVWLAVPAVNLRARPERSEPPADLTPDELQRLEGLHQAARAEWEHGRPQQAWPKLEEALDLAPGHAELHWLAGEVLLARGESERAREQLWLAVDHDWEGRRASRELANVIRGLCAERDGVTCVDVQGDFEAASPEGIPGYDLFVDFCHPEREQGVQLIAEAFAEAMAAGG